jgi:hypothetical protein
MRGLIGIVLCAAVGCVGDNTVVNDSGGPDVTTTDVVQANEAGTDVIVDVAPPCDATSCNGSCVDLSTSAQNCGVCGHSCAAGACAAGQCQPYAIQTGLNSTYIATDSTGLYYSSDHVIDECALDTCKPSPTQLWDNGIGQYIDGIGVGNTNLYFLGENNNGKPAVYRCPSTGCTTPTLLAPNALSGYDGPFAFGNDVYFAPISSGTVVKHSNCQTSCTSTEVLTPSFPGDAWVASDGTSIFVLRVNTGAIYTCPTSGAASCAMTTPFATVTGAVGFAVQGTTLYIALSGASGYTNGSIKTCSTSGTTCTPALFTDKLGFPQAFAADATGVYWWAQDEQAIKSCAIGGCINGQHTVVTNVASNMNQLRAQTGALYWVVPGATQNTTQIMRVVY